MASMLPIAAPGKTDGRTQGAAVRKRIGGRYEVLAELGRGGVACVYRVMDAANGCEIALKQLSLHADPKRVHTVSLLFEREFSTLAQLSHPRVIAVYDYGLDADGPYYTMELLDGGDLREHAPLPWQKACALIFDVCSSLSLLHARRLVHRDVSPRNVRCTRDGHAKLIDFGATASMDEEARLVGTPPFIAPEAVHGLRLDARSDLFSLGATLYFALTGRLAFPVQDLSQLREVWSRKPASPSARVPEIPPALDRLVLSLISLEPALRPRSAFEVMQRLAALAGIEPEEPLGVSNAYLVAPSLIGREPVSNAVREHLRRATHGRGRALLFSGAAGLGRTRMLDSCVLDARLLGARVVRVSVNAGGSGDFTLAHALAATLFEAAREPALATARRAGVLDTLFESAPGAAAANSQELSDQGWSLRSFGRPAHARPELQRALAKWFVEMSRRQPLMLAVDDVQDADPSSIALLAGLAERARSCACVILASVECQQETQLPASIDVLRARCLTLALRPLDLPQTEQLLCSLFGDVPNLALVSTRIHDVAAGNPRQIMALAQHLVDREMIAYEAGAWSLPQQLTASDMPASSEDALRVRMRALSALARRLAEAQGLAQQGSFSHDDYARLAPDADSHALSAAVDDLLVHQIMVNSGQGYMLSQRTAADVLCAELSDSQLMAHHCGLAALYASTQGAEFAEARHWLLGGEHAKGLERLLAFVRKSADRSELIDHSGTSEAVVGRTLEHALQLALSLRRPLREQHDLRHAMVVLSVSGDDRMYYAVAPAWLAQLELDSGLTDYRALRDAGGDPGPLLMRALQSAMERHTATPEAERVYAPTDAIRLLVLYAVVSIALGMRAFDSRLLNSVPGLLEPFAPLSPLVAAIWQNAVACCETNCYRRSERACELWIDVYERLASVEGADTQLVSAIRNAIAYGVGAVEASMGLPNAKRWAEILDGDPLQRVGAMYLRKLVRMQQGDLEGAERCRKQAELLELQSSMRQMFQTLLVVELAVHSAAWDLLGVKQLAARIEPLAERYAGWRPFRHVAQASYQRLRGDIEAARHAFEASLALCAPDEREPDRSILAWPLTAAGYAETLIASNCAAQAKDFAEQALEAARKIGMQVAVHDVVRMLALAEAKLGDYAAAVARLDALIEQQWVFGIRGLSLGASYEARARVAIWAGDRAAVEHFGRLTAEQYRHGRGSSLGMRYERLMEEARGAGVKVLPALSPFEVTILGTTDLSARDSAKGVVSQVLSAAKDAGERSQRALELLCQARGASAGHLFLGSHEALRCTASSGVGAPDEVLQQLVNDFWSQQQSEDLDLDTAVGSDTASIVQHWTDRSGVHYRPLLISGRVEGANVRVGVAVLMAGDAASQLPTSMNLVAELGTYLLYVGDCCDLRTSLQLNSAEEVG